MRDTSPPRFNDTSWWVFLLASFFLPLSVSGCWVLGVVPQGLIGVAIRGLALAWWLPLILVPGELVGSWELCPDLLTFGGSSSVFIVLYYLPLDTYCTTLYFYTFFWLNVNKSYLKCLPYVESASSQAVLTCVSVFVARSYWQCHRWYSFECYVLYNTLFYSTLISELHCERESGQAFTSNLRSHWSGIFPGIYSCPPHLLYCSVIVGNIIHVE